jgi:alpha-D-ribose 1-methylphosphonate 5-triphosphate synthase subunit PhnH
MKTSLPGRAKHDFDMVDGTQEVFRLLLEALSNPGRPVDLSAQTRLFAANGQWLAPALTLLNNECGFYWDGPPEAGEEIRFLSGAAPVPPENADFVFLPNFDTVTAPETEKVLSLVKDGTHRDPHDSALVFIAVKGKTDRTVLLKGPGIPPEGRSVPVSAAEAAWIKARDVQGFEYPRGVEIIFMREDNTFFALTRKVSVTWPM